MTDPNQDLREAQEWYESIGLPFTAEDMEQVYIVNLFRHVEAHGWASIGVLDALRYSDKINEYLRMSKIRDMLVNCELNKKTQ